MFLFILVEIEYLEKSGGKEVILYWKSLENHDQISEATLNFAVP